MRKLKGGKGSLKASKIKTQDDFDDALDKAAEKCSELNSKIGQLQPVAKDAMADVDDLETDVEQQAIAVSNVNVIFPSTATDPKIVADQADLYLVECRELEDEVNAYKKAVYELAKIEAQLESYEAQLETYVESVVEFIEEVKEDNPDYEGMLPVECT